MPQSRPSKPAQTGCRLAAPGKGPGDEHKWGQLCSEASSDMGRKREGWARNEPRETAAWDRTPRNQPLAWLPSPTQNPSLKSQKKSRLGCFLTTWKNRQITKGQWEQYFKFVSTIFIDISSPFFHLCYVWTSPWVFIIENNKLLLTRQDIFKDLFLASRYHLILTEWYWNAYTDTLVYGFRIWLIWAANTSKSWYWIKELWELC